MYYPKIVVSTHKICRDCYISSSGRKKNMSFYMFFCLAIVVAVGDGHLLGGRERKSIITGYTLFTREKMPQKLGKNVTPSSLSIEKSVICLKK